jgi:hypothetical protein
MEIAPPVNPAPDVSPATPMKSPPAPLFPNPTDSSMFPAFPVDASPVFI